MVLILSPYFIEGCCPRPGPGSSWGNLAAQPASKEANSPSHLFHSIPGIANWN